MFFADYNINKNIRQSYAAKITWYVDPFVDFRFARFLFAGNQKKIQGNINLINIHELYLNYQTLTSYKTNKDGMLCAVYTRFIGASINWYFVNTRKQIIKFV